MKLRINEKSVSVKVKQLMELAENKAKGKLKDVAEDLVTRTPVDTGAYAESFSVRPSTDSGGRRRTSHGRPRNQDLSEYRGVALGNMTSDIEQLDLTQLSTTSVSFRNRAPHAQEVENKYQVFGAAKDVYK